MIADPDRILFDCDVQVEGNRIIQVGRRISAPDTAEIIDAAGCAVLPGLINAHTHLYQNFLKGVSAGIPLVPWCNEVLFPTVGALREAAKVNRRIPYVWTALAAIEMIKGGITACVDMDVTYRESFQAWREAGFRGILAYTLTNRWVPAELRSREAEMRATVVAYVDEFHRPQGLNQVFLAPSTVFLCDDDLLAWVRDLSEQRDLGVQVHVSETAEEVSDSLHETGLRPLERLERLGLVNERLSAVHCVHLAPNEMEQMARSGAGMVYCPKSNMKLADGAAPLRAISAAGIPVALGTDGCASNDLLDMWEELRAGLLLARVTQQNAGALAPQQALRMATVDAARIARIDAGQLSPGKLADLIVVDLQQPHLQPWHADDPVNMLVFCARASDVRDTVIDGKIVMRNRQVITLDEEAILAEAIDMDRELFQRRQDFLYRATP